MGIGRPVGGITSPGKMIANIFVSFIGAGMLGLPFAFMEGGIMEGAVTMGLVGYLSVTAMLMLIDCKYAILTSGGRAGGRSIIMDTKVPLIPPDSSSGDEGEDDERHPPLPSTDLTYGDVGLYALGPSGKRLVDAAIIVSQIGFCCGYLIYLCKNLNLYIPRLSQQLWLVFLLPPLYCLTLLRHLNKLAIFSIFAQVSNVLALTVVFWFDLSHSEEVPFTPNEYSLAGFPFFFAVSIYCYEGAGMILSLEESMAEHKRHKFRPIFVCTMSGLTLLYICFGVSGYASFGPHTMDIITLNLPHGNGAIDFAAIVKICLGVSLFFTYPMMLFPVTHLLDKTFGLNTNPIKGNIVRLILVVMTGLVVTAVPNFAILMSLIGATCCTLLAFILPASFHLSIFRQRLTKRQWYFDIMLIVLGVLGSIVGVWDALKRMNDAHDPLLDLNEFASVKNGTLHPLLNPHVLIIAQPTHRPADSMTTLSDTVISNISKAEGKYGGAGKVVGKPTTAGSNKDKGDIEGVPKKSKSVHKVNMMDGKAQNEAITGDIKKLNNIMTGDSNAHNIAIQQSKSLLNLAKTDDTEIGSKVAPQPSDLALTPTVVIINDVASKSGTGIADIPSSQSPSSPSVMGSGKSEDSSKGTEGSDETSSPTSEHLQNKESSIQEKVNKSPIDKSAEPILGLSVPPGDAKT